MFYFIINCIWPICVYFAYIHCGNILKNSFHYTATQVIHQNFILSIVQIGKDIFACLLSYRVYPLKILKVHLLLFLVFILICPFLLETATSSWIVFLVQYGIILSPRICPAIPIFYKNFPVL